METGDSYHRTMNLPRTLSRRHRRLVTVMTLIVVDAAGIVLAGGVATWIRFGSITAGVAFEDQTLTVSFWQVVVVVVPLWVAFMALGRLYDTYAANWGVAASGRVMRTLSLGVVALILLTFLAKLPGLSRAWTLLVWVLSVIFVLLGRAAVNGSFALLRRGGRFLQRTLIVGSNGEAADIVRVLRSDREAGLLPVGCVASSLAERLDLDYVSGDIPVVGFARNIVTIVHETSADTVVIASSAFDHDVLANLIAELRAVDVDVHLSSGLFEVLTSRVLVNEIAGVPLVTIRGISLSRGNLFVKRAFDLGVSFALITVGAPVFLALAAAIKLSSAGPIFYRQTRLGRDGATFEMMKFRSMYVDADERLESLRLDNEASGPLFKIRNDPRVTPVGKWLRKFSIDEFPQLMNVVYGEMSLVGPRPPLPCEVDRYSSNDWRRLEVPPGMTGLWQVSGRSTLTFDEMVRLDLFYIENWSVALDLSLMFRTIPAVLFARGAY